MSDLQKIHKQVQKKLKEARQQQIYEYKDNDSQSQTEDYYESPYTMENGTATFLYIIVMLIGTIFNARVFIWGAATIIYVNFINRHKRRK